MSLKKLLLPALIATISITGCQTTNTQNLTNSTPDGIRQVNNVKWDKSGIVFEEPNDNELAENQSRIILFRVDDAKNNAEEPEDFEDSVIVGIGGKFQVSLQPGQHSIVTVCSGPVNLSTELTGQTTNHLANPTLKTKLQSKHTHYFQVDNQTENNNPSIKSIEQNEALNKLQGSVEQTHQISRVLADQCIRPVVDNHVDKTPVVAPKVEANTPVTLDVFFDFDSAQLREGVLPKLRAVAEFMQNNPKSTVMLDSHTDSKGPASYNLKLSERRANSVKDVLTQQYSIKSHRIDIQAHGESNPIDTNATKEGRQNNRRVVATIRP